MGRSRFSKLVFAIITLGFACIAGLACMHWLEEEVPTCQSLYQAQLKVATLSGVNMYDSGSIVMIWTKDDHTDYLGFITESDTKLAVNKGVQYHGDCTHEGQVFKIFRGN